MEGFWEQNLISVYLATLGQVVMLPEGHMDDGFSVVRARAEESRSAGIIRKSTSLFIQFFE